MKNQKITKKSTLEYILENCSLPAEYHAKVEAMLASEIAKANGIRKPTANQRENAELRGVILSVMEIGTRYRAMEIAKILNENRDTPLSGQRVSAILRQMKLDGEISKVEEKRISYFVREA